MGEGIVPFRHMADIRIAREIGNRIRITREAAGISQQVLGSRMGRTQTAISYWEGGRREIGVCDLLRIAAVLEVPPASLLPGEQTPTPATEETER